MVATESANRSSARPRAEDLQALFLDDVFRYVSAFVRPPDEAEDVTMLVFHAAYSSIDRLRRNQSARLWLLGIARRKVADNLRRRYRRPESHLSDSIPSASPDLDRTVIVGDVLRQIPADQGQVLVLKYINGLSIDEIAHFLGRSLAATNSLLQRARESFYAKGAPHFLDSEDRS